MENEKQEKRIETVIKKLEDIKTTFGNPRKISKKKTEELKQSLEMFGDFGIFLLNEKDEIIGGNMRLMVLKEMKPLDFEITCKRLIGYTDAELKAINIKDNTHAGEWDLDLLANWTADLNIGLDLGLDLNQKDLADRKIKEMELITFEKYNYVLIVTKNELDFANLEKKLGIEKAKVKINEKKKIKARAVWYDEKYFK